MYTLRFSLFVTLCNKHKINKSQATKKYGDPITCRDYKGNQVSFLDNTQVYNLKKEFLTKAHPQPLGDLGKIIRRISNSVVNEGQCAIQSCTRTDIEIHHIRKLYKRTREGEGFSVIVKGKTQRITGQLAIESALKRKQIPLCKEHHKA